MAQQNAVEKDKAVRKTEPGGSLSPLDQMERMLDEYMPRWRGLRPGWPAWAAGAFDGRFPKVDVIDRDADIVVRAEVPGVDKKDLEVSLTDGSVTIRGETHREEEEEKGDYYRCELAHGSFARTVPLPAEVDSETVKTSFKDGVLELVLHKVEKSRRRSISLD
jgi:HSP20 family protein